jgi:hypothetical protein
MKVSLTNISSGPLTFTPTAAIPLYGRSADSLRDHRHVTSLLHRIHTLPHGVMVRPTLSFDERGHLPNSVAYSVLGATAEGGPPSGFFPLVEDFVGEGGCLDWPLGVVENRPPTQKAGSVLAGYEAMGALRFPEITLPPGGSASYVILLAVTTDPEDPAALLPKYASAAQFDHWFAQNQAYWQGRVEQLAFHTHTARYDGWLRWVTLSHPAPPVRQLIFALSRLWPRRARLARPVARQPGHAADGAAESGRPAVQLLRRRAHGWQQRHHHWRPAGRIHRRQE